MNIKWHGRIVNGVKCPYRPNEYSAYLKTLEGSEYEEHIQKKQEYVSSDQRAYFRSSIRWLIDNTESFAGWNEDELYDEILKELTSYTKCVQWQGEVVEKRFFTRTSSMNKKEMTILIDKFLNWLALDNIFPPSPQEAIIGKYATGIDKPIKRLKDVKLIIPEENGRKEE